MDVLVTCQYEEDPIKNRGARVLTTLYINFSDAQGQITLLLVVVSGRNLNSSKLSYMSLLSARMRMIDSSFVKIGPLVLEKILKGFLPYLAWRPSWSCDQHHVIRLTFPCT